MKQKSALLMMSLAIGLTGASLWICDSANAGDTHKRTPRETYEAGRRAYERQDFDTAKLHFREVLKVAPDFALAKMYLAQIRQVELALEARPLSEKLAGASRIQGVYLRGVSLDDALELARRELVRLGGGEEKANFQIVSSVPQETQARIVDFEVRDLTLPQFLDALSFAGDVNISWDPAGLAVSQASPAVANPKESPATRAMRDQAKELILDSVKFDSVRPEAALTWLRNKTADVSKGKFTPEIIARQPLDGAPSVTLDLHGVSLHDAVNSICVVADLDASWHSWGVGVARHVEPAVPADAP